MICSKQDLNNFPRPSNIKKCKVDCVCELCKKEFNIFYNKIYKKDKILCKQCLQKETLKERYGDEHYCGQDKRDYSTWQKKVQETMKNKYGVVNPGQLKDHKEKIEKSLIQHFGDLDNAYKKRQTKANDTIISRYGNKENYYKTIISHQRNTIGCDNVSQTEKWKYTRIKRVNEKYAIVYNTRGTFFEKDGKFYFTCKTCGKTHCQNDSIWSRCYNCFPINKDSHTSEEQCEVYNFLKNYTDATQNVKSVLPNNNRLEIDIVTDKFFVEYDGSYWHNNMKDVKMNLAESIGKQLIRIYDVEWKFKTDIVKSILKTKLGIFDKKYYARNCYVKEISNKDYELFCEVNHLQGSAKASIKLGLFNEDTLLEIMSFGKPRFAKEYEYELIRECSALNTCIVGGKNKLFKYFEKTYNPKSVISYCDRRYFNGHSYESLGFKFIKNTAPAFSVINKKDGQILNRLNFTKQKMSIMKDFNYDPRLTQIENILENNLLVMWDNGNKVFVKCY